MFKKINNFVAKYSYSDNIKKILLGYDAVANLRIENNKNFFDSTYREEFQKILLTKIFLPYMIEKFIVFSKENGKTKIENNALYKIYNMVDKIYDKELAYEKLFFLGDKEQIRYQDKNYLQLRYRYMNLFLNDNTSQQIIKYVLKMDLNQFILLYLSFVSFICNFKEVEIYLDIVKFKQFCLNGEFNFSDKNINDFIEYISISKKDFQDKYFLLRKKECDDSKNLLSNEKLSKVDKMLPKLSFFYPLIKQDTKYYFSSYTGILEFLKLERIFTEISENKDILKNYKGDILGKKLIEEYTRKQAQKYKNNHKNMNIKVYGGLEYKHQNHTKQNKKLDEPDVIFETDDFYIFIECKNSISHLIKTIHDFDDKIKDRIKKDLNTSEINVKKYIEQDNIGDKNKKIYKFLMYFNATPVSVSGLKFDIFKDSDFILTEISSIELLFRVKTQKLNDVIDDYINQNELSIYEFIKFNEIEVDTTDFENTLSLLVEKNGCIK